MQQNSYRLFYMQLITILVAPTNPLCYGATVHCFLVEFRWHQRWKLQWNFYTWTALHTHTNLYTIIIELGPRNHTGFCEFEPYCSCTQEAEGSIRKTLTIWCDRIFIQCFPYFKFKPHLSVKTRRVCRLKSDVISCFSSLLMNNLTQYKITL